MAGPSQPAAVAPCSAPTAAGDGGAPRVYTVRHLAQLWHRSPATVRGWIFRLRQCGRGPTPSQARLLWVGNRWRLEVSEDYASLIQSVFVDRTAGL